MYLHVIVVMSASSGRATLGLRFPCTYSGNSLVRPLKGLICPGRNRELVVIELPYRTFPNILNLRLHFSRYKLSP